MLLSAGGSYYRLLYSNFFNTAQVRAAAGIPQYVSTINGDMSVWQRNTTFTTPATASYTADRYRVDYSLTAGSVSLSQVALAGSLTAGNYQPAFALRATVATADASPGAGDFYTISQRVELRNARKLFGSVTSLQLWVRTSVAGTYCLSIRNANNSQHFKQDFNVGTPNTWQQLTIPNIATMPTGSGTWGTNETDFSYVISICILAGSTFQSSDQSSWTSGNNFASSSQTNLLATLSATFDICLLQHESGPVCTPFMPDDDFSETLSKCTRYYAKSYAYGVFSGSVSLLGQIGMIAVSTTIAVGWAPFGNRMRVAPGSVSIFNPSTGAAGANGATGATVPSANIGDTGFFDVTGTAMTAGTNIAFHFIADVDL